MFTQIFYFVFPLSVPSDNCSNWNKCVCKAHSSYIKTCKPATSDPHHCIGLVQGRFGGGDGFDICVSYSSAESYLKNRQLQFTFTSRWSRDVNCATCDSCLWRLCRLDFMYCVWLELNLASCVCKWYFDDKRCLL